MDSELQIKDLKGFIRRRKKSFAFGFLLIFLLAVGIAFILPPVYKSQATILIENQQIPDEYVKSTITSYVEERLQMINRQIMSRANLLEVIEKFDLYPEMKDQQSTSEIISKLRKNIELKTISADIIDKRTGRASTATIAFTLAYSGKDPATVQKVTNELSGLYLEEDLKTRERLSSVTTDFLKMESESQKEQIQLLEKTISEYKKAHIGELPENNAANLQSIGRLERDIDRLNMEIRSLEERKIYLKGQIASVDPLNPVITDEGKMVMNPKVRLKGLRLQLVSLQSRLSDKHPDLKKLKREIGELEAQVGQTDDSVAKIRRLNDVKGQLAVMQGKLGSKHPDVIKLARENDMLEREVAKLQTEQIGQTAADNNPDNPVYINLMTQIVSAETQLKALLQEKDRINYDLAEYRKKVENAPLIEKEYIELTRDYESAKNKYNEILNKLMAAKVAQGMETTQRGERFAITDPGHLPEEPYKPNRVAIVLLGFILAAGAGIGIAATQEAMDDSIKTADALSNITGTPVFSAIYLVESDKEKFIRRVKTTIWVVVVIASVGTVLILVQNFVLPIIN